MTPEQFALFAKIEEEHWWFVARRRIMKAVLAEVLPPGKKQQVVDIGCGTGGNIAALANDYACVGVDASTDAIAYARDRFKSVTFVQSGLADDPGPYVTAADGVLCMDVIEHIEAHKEFLSRLVTALRPGAKLLLTVPADMSLWSEHDETNHHFRRYALPQFADTWATLPVRTDLLSYFNSRLYPVVKGMRALSRARGHAAGSAGTDFAMLPAPINNLVERIFRGESEALVAAIGQGRTPYARGVSLIAVLERLPR